MLHQGDIYRLGIEGDLEEIRDYLYTLSSCVIFVKSSDAPHKKERGTRKLLCGIVRCCSFEFDWANTFVRMKLNGVDERHQR